MDTVGRRSEDALKWAALAAALAIGAFLRFDELGAPSYWLDEALDAYFSRDALTHPWWHWLTGFGREHGPLHFAIQLAFDSRVPAALFGVATIVLLWIAGRSLGDGAIAALLLAASPFHVYYSREARPYALLMLLATLLLIAVLRRWSIVAITAIGAIALYTSGIAFAMIVPAVILSRNDGEGPLSRKQFASAFLLATLFFILYRTGAAGSGTTTPNVSPLEILRAFSVSALGSDQDGRTLIAMSVFAVIGAISLARKDRRAAIAVIAMAVLPVVLPIVAVFATRHFFALRYVAPALPAFLLLVAIGIAAIRVPLIPLVIALITIRETWVTARVEPFQKLNWRGIAQALEKSAQPGDVILIADQPADVALRHYLRNLRPGVRVASVPYVSVAEVVLTTAPAVWMVTTYNSSDLSVREWMCRFPLLAASSLEGFRLHYAPSARHFLRERAGPAELRALGMMSLDLRAGTDDELFLGDGWAKPDVVHGRTYRWAIATSASLTIPRWGRRDRTIVFRALGPEPQTMRVRLNGADLGETSIANEWQDYSFAAPAALWRDGLNEIQLTFERTHSAPNDPRPLAVLFDTIAVRGDPNVVPQIPPLRLPADSFLDANALWRGRSPRAIPREELRRANVEELLVRLGFDPIATWPQIASGAVEIEDVVRTVAWAPDCEDDRMFLTRAFALLLQRGPNAVEERDLLARLQRGATRDHIVSRIVATGELKRALSRARERADAAPAASGEGMAHVRRFDSPSPAAARHPLPRAGEGSG